MTILVTGHTGLVGSAITRNFDKNNIFYNGISSSICDFRLYKETNDLIGDIKPNIVVIASAKVGGIKANNDYPVDFLSDNILINTNIINSCFNHNIEKVIFLGSSCIYPKFAPQPMKEEYLLTGELEPTNKSYALAKISGIQLINSYRKQYGKRWISLMPTNLYGENDNFNLQNSHVLPAMLRKFHEAKENNLSVELWGSGTVKREFLNSDDLADAISYIINKDIDNELINVGYGSDIELKELANIIKETVGHNKDIVWNTSMPDGPPRKLLNSSLLNSYGWYPKINIKDGIKNFYNWYLQNIDRIKK